MFYTRVKHTRFLAEADVRHAHDTFHNPICEFCHIATRSDRDANGRRIAAAFAIPTEYDGTDESDDGTNFVNELEARPTMKKIERKHLTAIRWFHWINFPILAIMIWSGTLIYWANDVYRVGFGDTTILKFYPESFYDLLGIGHRLAEGMAWHFAFMWLFAVNGILYVAYTIISGEWRFLLPDRKSFGEAWQVLLHDLHLSRTHPPPRKYNGAQQIAYTAIVLMGAGSLITGLAIYKPTQLSWLTSLIGGYEAARVEHFALTIGYVLFFVVHIAQVIKTGWNNFRSMVTGYEVVPTEEAGNEGN